ELACAKGRARQHGRLCQQDHAHRHGSRDRRGNRTGDPVPEILGEFNQGSANRMLRGGVCGILGFGNVGVATARLMRAFGMKIHAINRRGASDEPTDWIATTDLLDEMLRVADVLVISAALTTTTEGLIGARELGLMNENAILINVARGEIIADSD